MTAPLLAVEDLSVRFGAGSGEVRAADGVDLRLAAGESVALVGESGCGKSATALAILGLLPRHGRVSGGRIAFRGRDLAALAPAERRRVRGTQMGIVFQDPMTSLNPYLRIEDQLVEGVRAHGLAGRRDARARALQLLARVGVPDASARLRAFPHELSGGLRQRVMIAMALMADPDLLVADEPTTALDVTLQAEILALLAELRAERGLGLLLITHDFGVVAGTCDRVLVMYAGRIVEEGPTEALFAAPAHPYTAALLAGLPRADRPPAARLAGIEGLPPSLDRGPFGACRFAPRCARVRDACREGEPERTLRQDRAWRCVAPLEAAP